MFELDKLVDIGQWVLVGLGGLAAGLRVISPFTKTDKDDRALSWVDKIAALMKQVVVPKKMR